jgi:hypothetical protein
MIFKEPSGPISAADHEQILHLIEVSRAVLHANRNRSWNTPIDLITDDLKLAHDHSKTTYRINPDGRKKTYYGFAWNGPSGAVLWVRNAWTRPRYEAVRTLCHEVTHALVNTSVHGQTWRRAYALMLPFWLEAMALDPTRSPDGLSQLYDEMRRVTEKYRRRSNRNLFDIGDEVRGHVLASTQMWEKKKKLFIPTTV